MYDFSKEPLGIGQQLDQSIKLTRATYKSTLPIIALTIVIGILNAFAIGNTVVADDGSVPEMTGSELGAVITFALLQVYLYFLMLTRITFGAHNLGDLADAAAYTIKNLHRIAGLYILFMLILIVGYMLLIIPGFILTISLSVSFYCFILEKTGPIDSLKRSHSLVWGGNWGRTMIVFSVGGIIVMIFYFIIGALAGVAAVGSASNAELTINLISSAFAPFVQPYFIALGLVVYNDVRLRKEGGDLAAELDSL